VDHFGLSLLAIPSQDYITHPTKKNNNMTIGTSTMNEDVFPIENRDFPACHVRDFPVSSLRRGGMMTIKITAFTQLRAVGPQD